MIIVIVYDGGSNDDDSDRINDDDDNSDNDKNIAEWNLRQFLNRIYQNHFSKLLIFTEWWEGSKDSAKIPISEYICSIGIFGTSLNERTVRQDIRFTKSVKA